MISSHLVNGRFVGIIVALLPDLSDRWLKSSSAPSMSLFSNSVPFSVTSLIFRIIGTKQA